MQPKLSVILTTYNAFNEIHRALGSLLKSGWDNIEVIISAADDYDYSALKSKYPSLNIKQTPFQGYQVPRSKAFVEAVKFSTGEYISYLDAHDYLSDNYFGLLMPRATEQGAAFAQSHYVRESGEMIRSTFFPKAEVSVRSLCAAMGIFGFVGRREMFEKVVSDFTIQILIQFKALESFEQYKTTTVKGATQFIKVHTESDSFITRSVSASYQTVMDSIEFAPEVLGFESAPLALKQDIAEFCRIRILVNTQYEEAKKRNPFLDYQDFVAQANFDLKELKAKFSLDG